MRMIKKLSAEIKGNIGEAREKIKTAYELRDKDKAAADWYKEMAAAHLNFNGKGHEIVAKQISDAKARTPENPLMAGMTAVYEDMHADIMCESAEVQAMISAYK